MLTDGRASHVTEGDSPRSAHRSLRDRRALLPTLPGALVASGATVVFLVVFALSGWFGPTEHLDTAVLVHLRIQGDPRLLWIVSVPWLVLCCVIVLVIAARRHRMHDGVRALVILALCNVLGQVLKKLVLQRESLVLSVDDTYPSGHMIAFASVAVALWIIIPARMHRTYGIIAGIVLAVVAFELVRYGWHRPSDVLGSLCLVTAVSALAWHERTSMRAREIDDLADPAPDQKIA